MKKPSEFSKFQKKTLIKPFMDIHTHKTTVALNNEPIIGENVPVLVLPFGKSCFYEPTNSCRIKSAIVMPS